MQVPHLQRYTITPETNLGNLFGRARAVEQSPRFTQYGKDPDAVAKVEAQPQTTYHLALVKLTGPDGLDDATLRGIGLTLSQLNKLGMTPCVVLDSAIPIEKAAVPALRKKLVAQAQRLATAIYADSETGTRILDNVYSQETGAKMPHVFSRRILMAPLRSGLIPIILPWAYSNATQSMIGISTHEAVLALTTEFAGLDLRSGLQDGIADAAEHSKILQQQVSLDRAIILEPEGGIPRAPGSGQRHIFLNLEVEYDHVIKELEDQLQLVRKPSSRPRVGQDQDFSTFVDCGRPGMRPSYTEESLGHPPNYEREKQAIRHHLANMKLLRDVLGILPPSSSAIITSPMEAARSSKDGGQSTSVSAVGTRSQKNPLIYNLLTDKPPYSASLPAARLGQLSKIPGNAPDLSSTTFIKKGMPLTIIPALDSGGWTANDLQDRPVKLTDPRIDLGRLVHLINDSFNRKLDVDHYLRRINDRVAGLVIAGEYEGGALFTWETPPGWSSYSEGATKSQQRFVPYLDKFAVLKRSQGTGGVVDILFNTMVRSCFPHGVCWRSRQDNPVNRWYFERARGTCKLFGTNWTMFWTAEDVVKVEGGRTFDHYEAVCRSVEPSWADDKTPD